MITIIQWKILFWFGDFYSAFLCENKVLAKITFLKIIAYDWKGKLANENWTFYYFDAVKAIMLSAIKNLFKLFENYQNP